MISNAVGSGATPFERRPTVNMHLHTYRRGATWLMLEPYHEPTSCTYWLYWIWMKLTFLACSWHIAFLSPHGEVKWTNGSSTRVIYQTRVCTYTHLYCSCIFCFTPSIQKGRNQNGRNRGIASNTHSLLSIYPKHLKIHRILFFWCPTCFQRYSTKYYSVGDQTDVQETYHR